MLQESLFSCQLNCLFRLLIAMTFRSRSWQSWADGLVERSSDGVLGLEMRIAGHGEVTGFSILISATRR